MALNSTATMMPLYLTTCTGFEEEPGKGIPFQIALVPLCSYTASLLWTQFGQAILTQKFRNRLVPLTISVVVTSIGSIPYAWLNSDPMNNWLVYPLGAIQGCGIAMMLNTSTSLISDVIGQDSESSAFVYGIYSFADKMANGFMLFYLVKYYAYDNYALRWIVTAVPVGSAVGTAFFTWVGMAYYGDQMAKISVGSYLKKPGQATPHQSNIDDEE